MRFCHKDAIQLARSRRTKGMPWSLRPEATARPDGPAPTMTGPFTQMQRRVKSSSGSKVRTMGGMLREMLCIFFYGFDEREREWNVRNMYGVNEKRRGRGINRERRVGGNGDMRGSM